MRRFWVVEGAAAAKWSWFVRYSDKSQLAMSALWTVAVGLSRDWLNCHSLDKSTQTHPKKSKRVNNEMVGETNWQQIAGKGWYSSDTKTKRKPENPQGTNQKLREQAQEMQGWHEGKNRWTNKERGNNTELIQTKLTRGWGAGGETMATGQC